MNIENKKKIYLVDDDAVFLKLLQIEFETLNEYVVESYATGELCLENLSKQPDVIILDFHLDGITKNAMNGIETLDKIKDAEPSILVIMLSSQDKIEVAIDCMHHKATDYVVKSETAFLRLQKILSQIFTYQKMRKELDWYMQRM